MKKSIVFFTHALMAFLLLAGVSAFAQKKSIDNRAKTLTDSMKVQLSLTDEQYTKVNEINLEFMNKVKELKGEPGDKKNPCYRVERMGRRAGYCFAKSINYRTVQYL